MYVPAAIRRTIAGLLHGRRAEAGGVAVMAAVVLPAILFIGLGAMQLQYVYSVSKSTQDIADAAALWGAQQLTVTPSGASSRTQNWATAQLQNLSGQSSYSVTATQVNGNTMKVAIDANTPGFFGNMLPAGGFNTHVDATAQAAATQPLCVLVLAANSSDNLHLTGTSQMQSTCLVHSNSSLQADVGTTLISAALEAVTNATGVMVPVAQTGAPTQNDPFSALNITATSTCTGAKPPPTTINSSQTLAPGTYCGDVNIGGGSTVLTLSGGPYYFGGNLNIAGGSTLNFSGGEYYISGTFTVSGNSTANGTDVVLDFASGATMNLSGQAKVSLSGRQSGPLAGFVLVVDRNYTGNFKVQSDFITKMTGTVYSPTAPLQVQGTLKALQVSDWTVIDAESLQLTGSPDLVINSNYAGSSVPVPIGVGSNTGATHITQ